MIGGDGVDARFAGVLRFPGDVLGTFDCGMDVHRRNFIEVVGSEGTIEVPSPWQTPEAALILVNDERVEPETVDPYARELEEFGRARRGRPTAPARASRRGEPGTRDRGPLPRGRGGRAVSL